MALATTGYDVYNLRNIVSAAATFRFCEGSTLTRAQAMLAGWKDVGHVVATDITPSTTTSEHQYCRLGVRGTDKKFVTDSKLEFGIKCEEMRKFVMAMALMGDSAASLTQTAFPSGSADTLAFTAASPSDGQDTWYNITNSGVQLRELSAATFSVPARNVTAANATETFTLSAHGWENGTPVKFGGTKPTGIGAGIYYVRDVTTDTFKVSATLGGDVATFSDDGTSVTVTQQLTDGQTAGEATSIVIDAKVGAVRFLYTVVQTVTPTVTAPEISVNTNPDALLEAVTPMSNLTRTGYGRLLFYADDADNKLVGDYIFSCQITTKGGSGLDGSKAAQFDFTLTVLDDVGTFYVAK